MVSADTPQAHSTASHFRPSCGLCSDSYVHGSKTGLRVCECVRVCVCVCVCVCACVCVCRQCHTQDLCQLRGPGNWREGNAHTQQSCARAHQHADIPMARGMHAEGNIVRVRACVCVCVCACVCVCVCVCLCRASATRAPLSIGMRYPAAPIHTHNHNYTRKQKHLLASRAQCVYV